MNTVWQWRRCSYCGSTATSKWGSYKRRPWYLDGRKEVAVAGVTSVPRSSVAGTGSFPGHLGWTFLASDKQAPSHSVALILEPRDRGHGYFGRLQAIVTLGPRAEHHYRSSLGLPWALRPCGWHECRVCRYIGSCLRFQASISYRVSGSSEQPLEPSMSQRCFRLCPGSAHRRRCHPEARTSPWFPRRAPTQHSGSRGSC